MDNILASPPSSPIFSRLEREVIRLGIRDGEQARHRSGIFGLITLTGRSTAQGLSNPALESLRAWAELACALQRDEGSAPTTLLEEAGYTPTQISEVRRLVIAASMPHEGEKP